MTSVHIEKQDGGAVSVLFGKAFFVVPANAVESFSGAFSCVAKGEGAEAGFNVEDLPVGVCDGCGQLICLCGGGSE